MEYKYIVYTPVMRKDQFMSELKSIIEILRSNDVFSVKIWYGFAWGNWDELNLNITEIENSLKEQQQKTGEDFPGNDTYLNIPALETEITFCHESDIHIEFQELTKVVSDILQNWDAKGIVHCIRKNGGNISMEEIV